MNEKTMTNKGETIKNLTANANKAARLAFIGLLIISATACGNWEDQCRAEGNIVYQGQCVDRDDLEDFDDDDDRRVDNERFEDEDDD